MPDFPNFADLLGLAKETALTAGAYAREQQLQGVEVAATKSSRTDVVTAADRATEHLIRNLLTQARPTDGFLGEESGASAGTSGLTWVVDPIDGTVNYLYRLPAWAVSIAVVAGDPDPRHWRPLAGVVFSPVSGELFHATAGGGSWLGERRLAVNQDVGLADALIGTGFSYRADIRLEQLGVLERLIGRARDIRRIGAASLDLCNVAAGRTDAYYERQLNPWDHAAGALIAREAGAWVGGLHGEAESRAMTVAAAPDLARALAAVLEKDLGS